MEATSAGGELASDSCLKLLSWGLLEILGPRSILTADFFLSVFFASSCDCHQDSHSLARLPSWPWSADVGAEHGLYGNRPVALATRHGKQRVIAPALRHGLGASLLHLSHLDTDQLGSFCGTIARQGSALQACVAKAQLALHHGGSGLAIASEGCFGPHPLVSWLPVGVEMMVFLDADRQLTIAEELVASRTNFDHCRVAPGPDLQRRLAPCNPTRMASIRRLSFRLVRRLRCLCPACQAPGWGRLESEPGLPCAGCGRPTELMLWEWFGCGRCDHRQRRPRSDGLGQADPGHCPRCNP